MPSVFYTPTFRRLSALALAAATLACRPLIAHDMWIEPTTFSPESGDIVGLKLRVGQNLLGDPLARDSQLIRQFIVDDGTGRKPVVGRDGGFTKKVGDHVVVIPTVDPALVTPHTEAFQAVVWHCLVSHPKLQQNATKW